MGIFLKTSNNQSGRVHFRPSSTKDDVDLPLFTPYLLTLTPLSLCIVLAYILEISAWPGVGVNMDLSLDMGKYVDNAERLLRGIWPGEAPFYRAPLYSYFLSFFFWLGLSAFGVAVIQGILFAIAVLVTTRMACLEFGRMAGWIAGFLMLFYGGAAYWTAVLHSTIVELFFATICVYLVMRFRAKPNLNLSILTGLSGGALCLVRPNYLAVIPLALIILFYEQIRRQKDLRWPVLSVGLIASVFIITILPAIIHNNRYSNRLTLVSTNAAETYRLSNSYDSKVFNFSKGEQPRMPVYSKAFWRHQFRKGLGYWYNAEYPQNCNFYLFRENSAILKLLSINFSIIGSLFLMASFFYLKAMPRLWPYYLFSWGYVLTVVAFFIIGRFRIPSLAPMVVVAAGLICELYSNRRKRSVSRSLLIIGVIIGLIVLTRPFAKEVRQIDYFSLSRLYIKKGDFDNAKQVLLDCLKTKKDPFNVYIRLSGASALQRDYPEAFEYIKRVEQEKPGLPLHYGILIGIYTAAGDREQADQAVDDFRKRHPQAKRWRIPKEIKELAPNRHPNSKV